MQQNKDLRDAFFDEVYELACKDKNVIFVSADADAFSLQKFKRELPNQYINVGVAEQNMVLLATGLALAGKKVFIYSITPFITMRCYEQLKVNVCSMNLGVAIVGTGAGFSFSYDGPTHHATQDIAVMKTLPEVTIINPCDEVTAKSAAQMCYDSESPIFVRIDKGAYDKVYTPEETAAGLKETSTNSVMKIVSTGFMTHEARAVADRLEEKYEEIKIDVVDVSRLKPINEPELIRILSGAHYTFTLEENVYTGGLGSTIAELICDKELKTKLKRIALRDQQVLDFGSREWHLAKDGLDKTSIMEKIEYFLFRKGEINLPN